ncbi:Vta1 like-domain-containing protein [Xylariales sp. PMI_506]|nr:Vta1 like-domain-containing protein [Xylariales sp. PMI_506]
MAANIPAKLKPAGITPFVLRANQLEQAKPVISYWCRYWVVNQILAKQLHNADDESLHFTTALMDKLEEMKTEQAGNAAVHDDQEGQTYVEQFANETFERAMRTLNANKVTQQTGITFEAAATFMQLSNIWGPAGAETDKKIKFAKWNAARILRAVKEGKDPNESNPKQEEEERPDEVEAELQDMLKEGPPQPVTVEDVPDEESKTHLDPSSAVAPGSEYRYSPGPVSAPTSPPQGSASAPDQVSPIAPPEPDQPTPSDGYFLSAPADADQDPPLELPSAPSTFGRSDLASPPTLPDTPQSFPHHSPAAQSPSISAPSPSVTPIPPPQQSHYNNPIVPQAPSAPSPAQNFYTQPPRQPTQPVVPAFSPPPTVPPPQTFSGAPPTAAVYNVDDMAMVQAQKHAKWAISALNFEDVPTAVRELRAALASLGSN